jgi:hypothetical protein
MIGDIAGETGLRILDAIVSGERDVRKRAKLRDRRIRSSEKTLMKALTGDYREEHLFTLRQSLKRYRFLTGQIADCDQEITRRTEALEGHAEAGAAAPEASKALKALVQQFILVRRHPAFLFGLLARIEFAGHIPKVLAGMKDVDDLIAPGK